MKFIFAKIAKANKHNSFRVMVIVNVAESNSSPFKFRAKCTKGINRTLRRYDKNHLVYECDIYHLTNGI